MGSRVRAGVARTLAISAGVLRVDRGVFGALALGVVNVDRGGRVSGEAIGAGMDASVVSATAKAGSARDTAISTEASTEESEGVAGGKDVPAEGGRGRRASRAGVT